MWQEERQQAEAETTLQGIAFPQKQRQAVQQVASEAVAVSVLGGFQDLTGQSPEEPGLTPEREGRPQISQGPFQRKFSAIPSLASK